MRWTSPKATKQKQASTLMHLDKVHFNHGAISGSMRKSGNDSGLANHFKRASELTEFPVQSILIQHRRIGSNRQ